MNFKVDMVFQAAGAEWSVLMYEGLFQGRNSETDAWKTLKQISFNEELELKGNNSVNMVR